MAERIVCQLCDRRAGRQHAFVCTSCACAAVYEARFKSAQTILQKEASAREVEQAVEDGGALAGAAQRKPLSSRGGQVVVNTDDVPDEAASARRLAYDQLRSARAQTKLRTRAYDQAIQDTEVECDDLREEIHKRKEDMANRRGLLQKAQPSIDRIHPRLDAINLSSAKIASRADVLQKKTGDARAYMVREAANLWGLTVKRKRGRDGKTRKVPYLAQLPVPDLRDLLSVKPDQINASLTAIVYMLNQTCSYLGLQMPSQLLLPDKDHAHPRILPVHSSYTEVTIPSPQPQRQLSKSFYSEQESRGSGPDGPDGAGDAEPQSRARPLHLEQPLLKLFGTDTLKYESFVEAVSLLAFDVAWLAKTQGIDVCAGRKGWSWDGACDLGRNLWLIFGPPSRRNDSAAGTDDDTDAEALVKLGAYSHGTNMNNAAGPDAALLGLREWRLANPNSLIRRLKDALADRKMAGEWELLEEDEWGQDAANTDTGGERTQAAQQAEKEKPAKGWQKLRQRNADE